MEIGEESTATSSDQVTLLSSPVSTCDRFLKSVLHSSLMVEVLLTDRSAYYFTYCSLSVASDTDIQNLNPPLIYHVYLKH